MGWVIRVLTVKGTPTDTDFGSFTRGLGFAIPFTYSPSNRPLSP